VTLNWDRLPDGTELACGTGWTYLIARDDRTVTLTRWETASSGLAAGSIAYPGMAVARQAALYAIQLGGAYGAFSGTADAIAGHLREAAQEYESGRDVTGQPAWRH
jgi:hypothetical protein